MEFVPFWIVLAVVAVTFLFFYRKRLPQKTDQLVEKGFVAIDCLATGMLPGQDDLLQLGAVRYEDGKEVDRFASFVRPVKDPAPETLQTLGLTTEDLDGAPLVQEAMADFIDFIQGYPVIGHHVALDLRFIHLYAPNYQPPAYDTLAMSRRVHRDMAIHDLTTMADLYDIDLGHGALANASASGQLFLKLLDHTIPMGPEHRREVDPVDFSKHMKKLQTRESQSEFTPQDQDRIEILRQTLDAPHLTFAKDGDDLQILSYKEIARIQEGPEGTWVLMAGRPQDVGTVNRPLLPLRDEDKGKLRFSLASNQDLATLKAPLEDAIHTMDLEIGLLDRQYQAN